MVAQEQKYGLPMDEDWEQATFDGRQGATMALPTMTASPRTTAFDGLALLVHETLKFSTSRVR
jgi:hypothetical protein